MLILSRRVGQVICIGDNVRVTVLAVRGLQARIGIDAPDNIEVHREEIYDRIQKERASAVSTTATKVEGK